MNTGSFFRADMWICRAQRLKEKAETMKLLPDNIKVLYFASDYVEPYVEVCNLVRCTAFMM